MRSNEEKSTDAGFTLVELMTVVGIIAILTSIAIPSFIKHLRRTKTVEGIEALHKIKEGARDYFMSQHWTSNGKLAPRQFPTGVTALPQTGPCCDKCTTPSTVWDNARWGSLKFALTEPHYYAFSFSSAGSSGASVYTARAMGDLDCDSTQSTFELRGAIDGDGAVVARGPIILMEVE